MEERSMKGAKPAARQGTHKLTLTNRHSMTLTGICDVISFDLNQIVVETEMGMLQIKGSDLHVNRIAVDKGEVDVEGKVDSLVYSEVTGFAKKSESMFSRLFK